MCIRDSHLIEHEYQKSLKEHGIKIRPDLVLHVPFEKSVFESRTEGNLAVIELKLHGTENKCIEDYQHLSEMCEKLDYKHGIFINIGHTEHHFDRYTGPFKERIHAFSVNIDQGLVSIHE